MRKLTVHQYTSLAILIITLAIALGRHYGWLHTGVQQAITHDPNLYTVNHFIDGDTISVTMNGKAQTIRFIGVDTPETHKPHTPVQCYGEQAAAFTKAHIQAQGNRVRLQADPVSDNRDVYGRLVRYVYLPDGQLLDELLIQNGEGFAYTYYPFTKSGNFSRAQTEAQASKKGLWGACKPYQEAGSRWQTQPAGA